MSNLINKFKKKSKLSFDSHSFSSVYENSSDMDNEFQRSGFKWNSIFIYLGFLFVGTLFFFKLSSLQIIKGSYYRYQSETNRQEEINIRSPRGVIYDVNGIQLTNNAPVYRLMLDLQAENLDLENLVLSLSDILEVDAKDLKTKIAEKSENDESIVLLERELTKDQFLLINANEGRLIGVYVEDDVKRVYPYSDYLSHIIGYTGEVNAEDLEFDESYSAGDIIGKIGLEYQYENFLRGEDGQQRVVIDVSGNIVSEQSIVSPVSGKNLKLSLDIEAQSFLQDALQQGVEDSGATGAAAVIADIETGAILSAVSLPSYDNNLFIGGISTEEYGNLINDEAKPLLNRFIGAAQPPGSTFKTITAVAGLDSGVIDRNTIYNSTGVFYLGNYPFQEYHKKSYGPINVIQALAKSSNIFFYETILELGIDNLSLYAEDFGLSRVTGIDIPGEISGNYSSPEYKALFTDEMWYPGDSLNASIGQGYNRVTPVQMLRWISAIGNGGTLVTPHFVESYRDENDNWVDLIYETKDLEINEESLAIVREGMREGVATGVVYTLRNTSVDVAAKTGTAEFGIKDEDGNYTKTHAWITGFFPYENPQYAFVFFQEAGGLGSDSGKVTNEFINWFVEYENSL